MNVKKTMVIVLSMAVLGAASASSARADEWNKLTYLTFSTDVAIPGRVLTAGYVHIPKFTSRRYREHIGLDDIFRASIVTRTARTTVSGASHGIMWVELQQ